VKTCPALTIPFFGTAMCKNTDLDLIIDYSPRNASFMENYGVEIQKLTEEFAIDTECIFSCAIGFHLTGSKKRHCLPVAKWDGLQTSCKRKFLK
jgi:CUB/sushi domain-containing protein